tara:strand:+ start:779 stop:949 length:171 start_codon:yes stop_codon:yes gene_type:complete
MVFADGLRECFISPIKLNFALGFLLAIDRGFSYNIGDAVVKWQSFADHHPRIAQLA